MKEASSVGGTSRGGGGGGKSPVPSRRGVQHPNHQSHQNGSSSSSNGLDRSNIKISNKNLAYSGNKSRSKEYLGSTTTVSPSPDGGGRESRQGASSVRSTTPVPAQRKTLKSASRTHLVEGIPQTEV